MRRLSPLLLCVFIPGLPLALSACGPLPLAAPDAPTPDPQRSDAVARALHLRGDALVADGLRVDADGVWLDSTLHVQPFGALGAGAVHATDPVAGACLSQAGCALTRVDEATTAWWEALPRGARLGWTVRTWEGHTLAVGAHLEGATLAPHGDGAIATREDGRGWRIGAPRAWDADGVMLPASMGVEGDTLRVTVDARGARAPVTVDPDFSAYEYAFYGSGDGWALSRVDGGRDINDDGEPDIVLGAPGVATLDAAYGSLVAFDRPTSGGYYGYYDLYSLSQLGATVRMVDDVTGDGKPDVVAGDPAYKPVGGTQVGRVVVIPGRTTGWWGSDAKTTPATGIAVAGVGASVTGGLFAGTRHVIAGAPTSSATGGGLAIGNCLGTSCTWSTYVDDSEGSFGSAVALGDFDGDGTPELWVGAPGALSGKGAVYGFEGITDVGSPTWRIFGLNGDRLGGELALHDIDGDGKDELFVGAPGANGGEGMVRAYFGRAQPAGAGPHAVEYPQAAVLAGREGSGLGWSLAVGGDADGDRVPDLLVGAPLVDDGAGAVAFVSGRRIVEAFDGDRSLEAEVQPGTLAGAYFGRSVAFVGDQTGDDIDDVAVGSPGDVHETLTDAGSVLVFRGLRDADGDGYPEGVDCDDTKAGVNPGATEACDLGNVDEDCDGAADGDDATGRVPWFRDTDGDGYGAEPSTMACDAPGQDWRAVGGDCDETRADVHPGAAEACNGRDDDCDGEDDEGFDATRHYADADADGFGDDESADASCGGDVPDGRVTTGGDCDDTLANVNPDAPEVCGDDLDSDCDGDPEAGCNDPGEFDAWGAYLGCATGAGANGSGASATLLLAAAALARRRARA